MREEWEGNEDKHRLLRSTKVKDDNRHKIHYLNEWIGKENWSFSLYPYLVGGAKVF